MIIPVGTPSWMWKTSPGHSETKTSGNDWMLREKELFSPGMNFSIGYLILTGHP